MHKKIDHRVSSQIQQLFVFIRLFGSCYIFFVYIQQIGVANLMAGSKSVPNGPLECLNGGQFIKINYCPAR